MAETTPVAEAATLPSIEEIERASAFAREPFLPEGEDATSALAPGTPRRRALDAALVELEAGAKVPSPHWRRQWSLLLGLDRILSEDEPKLVDGTVLSAHQVDALSGTLTALLADRLKTGDTAAPSAIEDAAVTVLAPVGIPGEEDDEEDEDEPEEPQDWDERESTSDEDVADAPEDPNAGKRFWFEHATGAGKTVAAVGFVEASRTGGVLILTHRRNLVDQFHGELRDRGYAKRIAPALLGHEDTPNGPVTVETYQWFVRNAGNISDAYSIVICDEAHTALGEKTSAAIRAWTGPVFIGMTATGALIARHVTDLFPTQTSRFDLAQAARRGVISPLRCVRIPPGPGVRTIAKVPLRRGEVDTEFDQEMLAQLLDQLPFNLAIADLYKTRFNGVPGVVYAAGVRHAYNVASAFRDVGMKAQAVSGETPKRELAQILARYERGDIDVLVNAQLLAEGWNSPRATVCMHLAPTASKRIYQQRVGRVTRRHQGKEAGIVVDFVHPATKHDDPVVTLHSLLDRDVYRGGAIVVGPVRRGRGRRLRVERRVLPVTSEENRRIEVFERELWRIAVEHLDYGEQVQWAALAGARVAPTGWRRARAMLHFDQGGELKRTFLITAVDRNKNPQLRLRALQEIASGRDAEAFDRALDFVESWPRDEKREGVKVVLQALAEKKIGRRDQANNWIWRCANMTREVHEEYAVQRWPETKRLLGLLVNSSGGAHARNARRLVHQARLQDRRLSAALLAAAIPHTAEAGEVINGARMRMARKPAALARELLRNFPKGRGKAKRRRRRKGAGEGVAPEAVVAGVAANEALIDDGLDFDIDVDIDDDDDSDEEEVATPARRAGRRRVIVDTDPDAGAKPAPKRRARRRNSDPGEAGPGREEGTGDETPSSEPKPGRRRTRRPKPQPEVVEAGSGAEPTPSRRSRRGRKPAPEVAEAATPESVEGAQARPSRRSRRAKPAPEPVEAAAAAEATSSTPEAAAGAEAASSAPEVAPSRRTRRPKAAPEAEIAAAAAALASRSRKPKATPAAADEPATTSRRTRKPKPAAAESAPEQATPVEVVPAAPARRTRKPKAAAAEVVEVAPKPRARKPAATPVEVVEVAGEAAPKPRARKPKAAAPKRKPAAASAEVAPKPRARKPKAPAAVEVVDVAPKPRARKPKAAAAVEVVEVAPKRKPRARKAAPEQLELGATPEPKPAARKPKAKPKAKAEGEAGGGSQAEAQARRGRRGRRGLSHGAAGQGRGGDRWRVRDRPGDGAAVRRRGRARDRRRRPRRRGR